MGEAVSQPAGNLLERAGRWFLDSGIQEPNGGVARYYRFDVCRNARVSTEITGYAVSTFVWLFELTGDEEYLDAAHRSARFLSEDAWDPELHIFPFEHGLGAGAPEPLAYFFDSGIIARGLLSLWRTSRQERWLDAAQRAGESMLQDFGPAADRHPILRLPSKEPLPYGPQWSRKPGCYQLKSALAWHDLGQATADRRFSAAFEEALAAALASHDRFLPGETPEKTMDRLHAYCYFLEALVPVSDREAVRTALISGIDGVSRYTREIAPIFVRSDVYAQLLRIRLWAENSGIALAQTEACAEAHALPPFQLVSEDRRLAGGFAFGRRGAELLPFANPVSTAFAAQAWQMWQERRAGETSYSRHPLI
jgi:hypothetical protein